MFHIQVGTYLFKPALIPTAVCGVLFVILLSLGSWQWERFQYKRDLENRYQQGQQTGAVTVADVLQVGRDLHSYPITLSGVLDTERPILLDNQGYDRQAGYNLLSPVRLEDGQTLLVNRGWLPMGNDRSIRPELPQALAGKNTYSGKVYFPSEKQFVLKEDDYAEVEWPLLVQKLDLPGIGSALGVELLPFVVRLDPQLDVEQGDELPRDWKFIVMSAEKSRGYSIQWYSMAAVLFILYLIFSAQKIVQQRDT
jgi:surfeit locus 1 family protein